MAMSYSKAKGRKDKGAFFMFPKDVWKSENYKSLSHIARSLLLDMAMQFNGKNNGDLLATFSYLSKRGWKSKTTIKKHLDELRYYGLIVCVQHGGINCGEKQRPNLYALTWLNIDKIGYSDGYSSTSEWKLKDVPGTWKIPKPPMRPSTPKRKPPQSQKYKKLKASSCTSLVPFPVPDRALSK